jgi:hypothetical protein
MSVRRCLLVTCSLLALSCGREEYPTNKSGQLCTDQELQPSVLRDSRVPVTHLSRNPVTPAPTLLLPDLTLPDTVRIELEKKAIRGDASAATRVSEHYMSSGVEHAAELSRYWKMQGAVSGDLALAYGRAVELMRESEGSNTTGVLTWLAIAENAPVLSQHPEAASKIRELRAAATSRTLAQ